MRISGNMGRFAMACMAVLLLGLTNADIFARDRESAVRKGDLPFKHEFSVGWGGMPAFHMFYAGRDLYFNDNSLASSLYGEFGGPIYMTGNIGLEYSYCFKKWFALSANVGMNGIYCRNYDKITGRRTGVDFTAVISVYPQVRFSYLNREYVKLYSSLGVGVILVSGSTPLAVAPVIDLVPIGITAGRKVYGFFELGFGTVVTGCSAGVGVRF